MRSVWERVASRYSVYQLALPGSPAFICQAAACEAHCCRAFSVNLGEREAERMQRVSGLAPRQFLECEEGEPVALPLAQPYLLARRDGRCALLRDDLGCGQYEGRPDACRLYPHFILFIDPETLRPVHADREAIEEAAEAGVHGGESRLAPLLLRHTECPGFTGEAMSEDAWRELFAETYRLQYGSLESANWPRR